MDQLTEEILNVPVTLSLHKILRAAGEVSKGINRLTKMAKRDSTEQPLIGARDLKAAITEDGWASSEYDSDDESDNTSSEWASETYQEMTR